MSRRVGPPDRTNAGTVYGMDSETRALVETLVAGGHWPASNTAGQRQNLYPLVAAERVRAMCPSEDTVFLYAPPFGTIAEEMAQPHWQDMPFWFDGFSPVSAAFIGDFGIGSDAPLVLDYSSGRPPPRVMAWCWGRDGLGTRWLELASSFEEFCEKCWGPT